MAEHTKASTAGSAHARYVAYREAGYTLEEARQSGGDSVCSVSPNGIHADQRAAVGT